MTASDQLTQAEIDRRQRERFDLRVTRFFDRLEGMAKVYEPGNASYDSTGASQASTQYFSLAEMFVRIDAAEWRKTDHVLILSVKDDADLYVFFVGPESIRNSAQPDPSGVVISELPIGRIPWQRQRRIEMSIAVLRARRDRRSHRVLQTIDAMIPGIDYANDPLGSLSWADAILERIDVLGNSPEGEWMLVAQHAMTDNDESPGTRYCAVTVADTDSERGRERLVRDGRLYDGPDVQLASPARYVDHALIRVGSRIDRREQGISLNQLRDLARVAGGASANDDVEEGYLAQQDQLARMRRLTRVYGIDGMTVAPVATPIALEVAGDLMPLLLSDESGLSQEFQDSLSLMRDGLRYELGFESPGVKVRLNEDELPNGSYSVHIRDIPLVTGNVQTDKLFVIATVDTLREHGIDGEAAINPANGTDAAWIDPEFKDAAEAADLTVRLPSGYVVLHLSSVIRKNAMEFLGVGAVAELLSKGTQTLERVRATRHGLSGITLVLRILLEEEVPIHAVEAISDLYLEHAENGTPLYETVEAARNLDVVRNRLHWNPEHVAVYLIGPNFERLLRDGIVRQEESLLLALKPEPTQESLTAVRTEVEQLAPDSPNPVLLVEDSTLRRPLRKLVELEFPHLRVLARQELCDVAPENIHPVATIEFDDD